MESEDKSTPSLRWIVTTVFKMRGTHFLLLCLSLSLVYVCVVCVSVCDEEKTKKKNCWSDNFNHYENICCKRTLLVL